MLAHTTNSESGSMERGNDVETIGRDATVTPELSVRTDNPRTGRKRRKSDSLYSSVLDSSRESRASSVGPEKITEELETYLGEPVSPFEEHENLVDDNSEMRPVRPLHWWKCHSHRFPLLSRVARDSLSLAASSGSIERCFSVATDILSAKRNRMKSDLFGNIMLIKCNAKWNMANF